MNGGKCGVCGDPFNSPQPRDNEYGGKYGLGVIVRKYNPGSEVLLRIELTASHMGYFEFRVCPDKNADQDCLDKYVLVGYSIFITMLSNSNKKSVLFLHRK